MGIDDFWPWLKRGNGLDAVQSSLEDIRGTVAGVDVSVWLNNCIFSKETRNEFARAFVAVPKVDLQSYIDSWFSERVRFLAAYDITPVFVLDGSRNPLKEMTNLDRQKTHVDAALQLSNYIAKVGDFDENMLRKLARDCVHVRDDIYGNLKLSAQSRTSSLSVLHSRQIISWYLFNSRALLTT